MRRKLATPDARRAALGLLVTILLIAGPFAPIGILHGSQPPASEHGAAAGEAHDAGHEESLLPLVAKIFNFAVLVGGLVYFLRTPLAGYLINRHAQVRADLDSAEATRVAAAAQIADMEAKLKALPAELDELKARGVAEIAAEEARIRQLAESERARLLDQAQRDIDQRVRLARRELLTHAANLAVDVAETRIKQHITDADQVRLVDRYLTQVSRHD